MNMATAKTTSMAMTMARPLTATMALAIQISCYDYACDHAYGSNYDEGDSCYNVYGYGYATASNVTLATTTTTAVTTTLAPTKAMALALPVSMTMTMAIWSCRWLC